MTVCKFVLVETNAETETKRKRTKCLFLRASSTGCNTCGRKTYTTEIYVLNLTLGI